MYLNVESNRLNSKSYGRIIWAPGLAFHDPDPPITIDAGSPSSDSVDESSAITDIQNATADYNVSVSESISATESSDASLGLSGQTDESVSVSDGQDGVIGQSGAVAEASSISDSQDATVIPGPPPTPPIATIVPCVNGVPIAIGTSTGTNAIPSAGVSVDSASLRLRGSRTSSSPLRAIGVANRGCRS